MSAINIIVEIVIFPEKLTERNNEIPVNNSTCYDESIDLINDNFNLIN